MYDSIEDETDSEDITLAVKGRRRLWLGFGILAGLAVLISVALFSAAVMEDPAEDLAAIELERKTYLAAISDPDAPLRRARLLDFKNTYPSSSRMSAVDAQLKVFVQAESADWAELTHVIFDTEKPRAEKLEALSRYETIWDVNRLGGRADDLEAMRKRLPPEEIPEIDPDASTDGDSSDTADTSDDLPVGDLAGGAADGSYTDIPDSAYEQAEESDTVLVVTRQPELIRNRRPRYPRRALRAEAEALIILRLYIDERGRVETTELTYSEADRYENDFIKAAERAAMRLRYTPKTVNGVPVPTSEITKRFKFQMSD